MEPWMGALMDNLEVLTQSQGGNWGRAATNDLLRNRIKIRSLNFMRGRTFLNRFLILDEAQNLTPKQMKALVTRRSGHEARVPGQHRADRHAVSDGDDLGPDVRRQSLPRLGAFRAHHARARRALAAGGLRVGHPVGMPRRKSQSLTQLGHRVAWPDSPDEAVLERVPNPHPDKVYLARFTAPEFTSLCPVTGQPDFAHLVIDYVPRRWLVESKSLKLYLGSFRNHGAFHEDCTLAIAGAWSTFSSRAGCASAAIGIRAAACRSTSSGRRADRRRTCGFPTRAWRPTGAGLNASCYSPPPFNRLATPHLTRGLMAARVGFSATISRESRQARKGATVTVISGAGEVPARAASN